MYTTEAEFEAYFPEGTPPTPYARYDRMAVSTLTDQACWNFPDEETFQTLAEDTQAIIKEAILIQIEHYQRNERKIRGGLKDVKIGKYSEKIGAETIRALKLSDEAVSVLWDSGVCSMWLEDNGGGVCCD